MAQVWQQPARYLEGQDLPGLPLKGHGFTVQHHRLGAGFDKAGDGRCNVWVLHRVVLTVAAAVHTRESLPLLLPSACVCKG